METICGAKFAFDPQGEPDLLGNESTGGAYRVMVGRAPAGGGPSPHVHPHTDEGHTAYITKPLRGLLIYSPGDAEHVTQPV